MWQFFANLFCKHQWVESYYDLRADKPHGPRTWHGIKWTCRKCDTISPASGTSQW